MKRPKFLLLIYHFYIKWFYYYFEYAKNNDSNDCDTIVSSFNFIPWLWR